MTFVLEILSFNQLLGLFTEDGIRQFDEEGYPIEEEDEEEFEDDLDFDDDLDVDDDEDDEEWE